MRRGEIWWADLPHPIKPRPVVVLTRNSVIDSIGSVVVGLVTTTHRNLPAEIALGRREGLFKPCFLNVDNLFTVRRERLQRLMGALSAERMKEVDAAIRFALELG